MPARLVTQWFSIPTSVWLTMGLLAAEGRADGVNAASPAAATVCDAAIAEDEETKRTYPSLPGALRKLPEWMKTDAPFDVVRFFPEIPPEENAAPLYLEALYEFAPGDMRPCMAPDERNKRERALLARENLTLKIMREGAEPIMRQGLVNGYAGAFAKLAEAQKRKRCAFDAGLGLDAMLHHAQASRAVLRLLDWRVEFKLAAGQIGSALDDVNMALRLARDLRPRGPLICQLVSVALDAVIAQALIGRVLAVPGLTSADCDRLLELLARHDREGVDSACEGFRVEYLSLRDLLHRLKWKEKLGDLVGSPSSSNGTVLARDFDKVTDDKRLEIAARVDELLESMTAEEFAAANKSLNLYFGPLVDSQPLVLHKAEEWFRTQEPDDQGETLFDLLKRHRFPAIPQALEAFRRDRTRMGAVRCLVALRRWQIEHGPVPPADLLTACKAAGLQSVPIDAYSAKGDSLRFTIQGQEPVVYSVGKDGADDGARLDWNWGQAKGDFIFRLPPVP